MTAPRELSALQAWMRAVVSHPAGVDSGIRSDEARRWLAIEPSELDHIILPSSSMTSHQRLAVYAHAYWARLIDCLRQDFPMLCATLGQKAFDRLAAEYLHAYPSTSYTLARLADRFPQYLAETRPAKEPRDGPRDWADFVVELAEFERAISQVFDAEGGETVGFLSPADVVDIPSEQWHAARLACIPCLRLCAFHFPINDFYTAMRQGQNPPMHEPRKTFVALSRRNYIVRRHALTADAHQILSALVAGKTLGEALAGLTEASGLTPDTIRRWFEEWTAAGFFRAVAIG